MHIRMRSSSVFGNLTTITVVLGLGASSILAQNAPTIDHTVQGHVEIGPSFPSGGDLNDTYDGGWFLGAAATTGVAPFLSLRGDADYAQFPPATPPKHTTHDSRWGQALSGNLGVELHLPDAARSRAVPTAIAEAGGTNVDATWLNADNVVLPYFQARMFDFAFGARWDFTPRVGFEIRRFTAHRGDRGTVGYIPATLAVAF